MICRRSGSQTWQQIPLSGGGGGEFLATLPTAPDVSEKGRTQVIYLQRPVIDNDVMLFQHVSSSLAVGRWNVKARHKPVIVPWNQSR